MEFVLNPDIVSSQLDDGESVLLNLTTRQYYTINETGSAIWDGIQRGDLLDDIVLDVVARFDVDEKSAREHVNDFLERLVDNGIVATR